MFSLRRWWDRYALRTGIVILVIGSSWVIRQTNGAFVFEIYRWVTRPFQGAPDPEITLKNAQMQELQQRIIELESQNQQLKQLIEFTATYSEKGTIAPVIGRSADHWWQQLTLGRGSNDGVEVGAVVSGTGGVIGRITSVTSNTSRMLLITDPSSQIGVTVSRSRYMGYLRGQAQNQAVMEFFDKVPDVRVGDVITTSSFSQLFPPGLPVGRVESVNLNKSPVPEAVVEITAPISRLEWVLVSPNSVTNGSSAIPSPKGLVARVGQP
jgi:rod shape-determining protein MreC